jgi:signal transduction histidine kinase
MLDGSGKSVWTVQMVQFHQLLGESACVTRSAELRWREEIAELWRMESRLRSGQGRLQDAERRLFRMAQRTRRGAGPISIRQIERERRRLGRELHTGVGQMLAAIRLQLELVSNQLSSPPPPVAESLSKLQTLAQDALEEVRGISRRLHPPEWQRLSLESALHQLWNMSGVAEKFDACLRIEPLSREPELEVKVLFYRAAQEALSNLIRHSRAGTVGLDLAVRQNSLVLHIRDNGVGFNVDAYFAAPALGSGIGLRSIRDQAVSIGGKLAVKSGPHGTTLEVTAPFLLSAEGM